MDLTQRADLYPLCPIHHAPMMNAGSDGADAMYACAEHGCNFHWEWNTGYFYLQDGRVAYPTNVHEILKQAPIREHGYMYIASIKGSPKQRTWRCSVKDCPNVIVDEGPPD
jgi:hypothetical protein